MCWIFFHDWSEWGSEFMSETTMVDLCGRYLYTVAYPIQRRKCLKCGKVQKRKVRERLF